MREAENKQSIMFECQVVHKIVLSNEGETIACGSQHDDYVQKWKTKSEKPVCEPMKWSEGKHVLDEMEQERLCGEQVCDAAVRKDIFPIEISCRAVCPDKNNVVLGLDSGSVAFCEWR